jgi:hypothetical protein
VALKRFVQQLKRSDSTPLAGATIRNILSVFRAAWDDACEEYGWDLADPLEYVNLDPWVDLSICSPRGSTADFRLAGVVTERF